VTDAELKQRFDEINSAIDEPYLFHGRMSPRLAAMRPAYLRAAGQDTCEVLGGLMTAKSPKAPAP
jgi:hypothetical protein